MRRRAPNLFTGLKIAGDKLIVATVIRQPNVIKLVPTLCTELVLYDRSQGSLVAFRDRLFDFLIGNCVDEATLRQSPEKGRYMGSILGMKVEAALQLVPSLRLHFVHPATINAWQRRSTIEPPEPDRARLKSSVARLQAEAIAVAVWSAASG